MATMEQVKADVTELVEIDTKIAAGEQRFAAAREMIDGISMALGNLPTKHAELFSRIDAYSVGEFETLAKADKASIITRYRALKAKIDTLLGAYKL